MSDLIIAVWTIAFLVTLIGCIPYGIWMIYALVKKRWKRLALQVGIPTVVFLLLTGISALVNASDYGRYLAGLYDTEVHLSDPIFEHNSDRSFHGDGYSISVHKLPSSIRKRFASADEKLFAEFPERPNYRNNWNIERWRQSPMDEQFQDHLDFALTSTGYNTEDSSELRKHFETIRAALKREGTFYAFFYSGQVSNIDFFVVDLHEGRLYLINHNT